MNISTLGNELLQHVGGVKKNHLNGKVDIVPKFSQISCMKHAQMKFSSPIFQYRK